MTIQNEVEPAKARALHTSLADGWQTLTACGDGLQLWHYRGGPCELAASVDFGGSDKTAGCRCFSALLASSSRRG